MIRSFTSPEKRWAGGLSPLTVPLRLLSEVASAAASVPPRPHDGEVTPAGMAVGDRAGVKLPEPLAQTPLHLLPQLRFQVKLTKAATDSNLPW